MAHETLAFSIKSALHPDICTPHCIAHTCTRRTPDMWLNTHRLTIIQSCNIKNGIGIYNREYVCVGATNT